MRLTEEQKQHHVAINKVITLIPTIFHNYKEYSIEITNDMIEISCSIEEKTDD